MCIRCEDLGTCAVLSYESNCLLLVGITHNNDGLYQLDCEEIHSGSDIDYNDPSQIRKCVDNLLNKETDIPIIQDLRELKCPRTNISLIKGIQKFNCYDCP